MEKWLYDNIVKIAIVLSLPLYLAFFAQKMYAAIESDELAEARYCMAQNIYFESANQSFAGRLAVGHVVINRVEDLQFPNSVCEVIYQAKTRINWKGNEVPIRNQCQFSWYCDGLSDEPVDSKTWIKSLYIADFIPSMINAKSFIKSCLVTSIPFSPKECTNCTINDSLKLSAKLISSANLK